MFRLYYTAQVNKQQTYFWSAITSFWKMPPKSIAFIRYILLCAILLTPTNGCQPNRKSSTPKPLSGIQINEELTQSKTNESLTTKDDIFQADQPEEILEDRNVELLDSIVPLNTSKESVSKEVKHGKA